MSDTNMNFHINDSELERLAIIYSQLQEPNRSIVVMGANLLLASQAALEPRKVS